MSGCQTNSDVVYLQEIEKQIQQNPCDLKLLLKKAVLYYEPFHKASEAADILKFIIKQDPSYIDAYLWLAEVLSDHLCQEKEAEEVLRQGLTIDPKHAGCHTLLGWLMLSRLDQESEFHYREAIKYEPTWLRPRICLVNYLRRTNKHQNALQEAQDALHYVVDDIPENIDSITQHYEHFITGRYDQKIKNKLLNVIKELRDVA